MGGWVGLKMDELESEKVAISLLLNLASCRLVSSGQQRSVGLGEAFGEPFDGGIGIAGFLGA
jgi:hypothetical protein